MDFILLSVYILTNICFSLGGMTPKTIIIASETSRWIHQSGTPPLTDFHASKQISSHNRASPYMSMTSVPVQTSITSSETSSISSTTSTSENQPIVPSRSTAYHRASAGKAISPRYSVNDRDSRAMRPMFSDSASDSSTHRTSAVHLSDRGQAELYLQSSMIEGEYDSATLETSKGTSTKTVNTETAGNLFDEKSLETVRDSLKLHNHQTQMSTSSISTFDILRDSNFTASQIADWFESVVSMSTSKSNTTSTYGNSSQTGHTESQGDSQNQHTSTYSKGTDQIPETLKSLSLSTTPNNFRNTLHNSGRSMYLSSDRVMKTDSITYSSASDFLVTYSLINVFKAQKEETQTTKGTYFPKDTSLLGITSLPKTSREESESETSDLQNDEEASVSQGLLSSLQSTILTSTSPSTENTDYMKTPSLQSHFMGEPSSRLFSTLLYENPVEIRGYKTPISDLTDNDISISSVKLENTVSAFSSRAEGHTLPVASSSGWYTGVTRTKVPEIISVSEIAHADFLNTAVDLHSSIQPDKDGLQSFMHSSSRTLLTTMTSLSVSPGLVSDITIKTSGSSTPSILFLQEEAFASSRSEGVIVTDSRKQAFSQTSDMASYLSIMGYSDIKPSVSKKTFTSTLFISDKNSSVRNMTELLTNQSMSENTQEMHAVIYSSDQSFQVSAVDLLVGPSDTPDSDITVTASDIESSSSLESIDGNTLSTGAMSTSSRYLLIDVSTVSEITLKSYSSELPVSAITVSSMSTQRHASTSMDMHSSEFHSKSNAEPFLQFPSISINIKTKHSRQKGTSENIPKDSPTALSTAPGHSAKKENTPGPAVAATRTSMSTFHSISRNDELFSDSHNDAAGYITSSSSEINPSDYSMVDTVVDILHSSQPESKTLTRGALKAPYVATISSTTIRGNGSIVDGESSSFPVSSSYEDNHSQKAQNTKFARTTSIRFKEIPVGGKRGRIH
ncbi:serine-rich adhesin for platelets-like [Haliotis asinina]|uniref:serine-rich adhesin for platelets-like n=1 Tax=Haliotis asinina TaxID=109174 RepID=UPI0035327722